VWTLLNQPSGHLFPTGLGHEWSMGKAVSYCVLTAELTTWHERKNYLTCLTTLIRAGCFEQFLTAQVFYSLGHPNNDFQFLQKTHIKSPRSGVDHLFTSIESYFNHVPRASDQCCHFSWLLSKSSKLFSLLTVKFSI